MEKKLILRGVLAGAVAGLLAFLFARIFAEPYIGRAIDYESGRDAAQAALDKAAGIASEGAESDLFSRSVQANLGIGVGMVVFGAAMGALFAVVYTVCLGRVGGLRARSLALLVAGGGFLGIYLVPFLKYPADPPGIGHEETIRARSGLYLVMVILSVAFLAGAVWLGRLLRGRFGNWNATLLACAAFVVAIGAVMLVLPSFGHLGYNKAHYGDHATETPLPLRNAKGAIVYPGFPADVLFAFRFYSVGAQLLLWSALGLVFAPLAERVLNPARSGGAAPAAAALPA
jgi:putative cobalt transporter subunit CbtA